jgi:hypothetical protein
MSDTDAIRPKAASDDDVKRDSAEVAGKYASINAVLLLIDS